MIPETEESDPPKARRVLFGSLPEIPSDASDIWDETLPAHPSMLDSVSGRSESSCDEPNLMDKISHLMTTAGVKIHMAVNWIKRFQ